MFARLIRAGPLGKGLIVLDRGEGLVAMRRSSNGVFLSRRRIFALMQRPRSSWTLLWVAAALATLATLIPARARAQLKGLYVAGFSGLQSGTQPPPSISVYLPLYFYTTDDFRDGNGHRIGPHPRINVTF